MVATSDYLRLFSASIVRRYDLMVQENATVSEELELNVADYVLRGIRLSSDREDLLFYRGSQQIALSGRDIVPEGFESKLLMSGQNVPPQLRYYETEYYIRNRKIEITFRDTDHLKAPFEPYRVT
ncbi:MAG: hypothetical protein AAF597_08465, partial [Bacteroidota bacterium]